MEHVLAVDGGNSKTMAAVFDREGNLKSLIRSGGSNFQGIGRQAASKILKDAIGKALSGAGVKSTATACYGIAGADRDKDFEIIGEMIKPFDPAEKSVLVNDTLLALRAGTSDGVGVALIGGAGSNAIGMDREGDIRKAWGLGRLTGDKGNAQEIVSDAVIAAMKGIDGRGPKTVLEDLFKKALGVKDLVDVIEFDYFDSRRAFDYGSLCPLVFEAADRGDKPAIQVLEKNGEAVGEAALAVLRGLFKPEDKVPLVLGGSVLQKGSNPALINAIRKKVSAEFPSVEFTVLKDHPLLGGVLRAMDELLGEPAGDDLTARIRENLYAAMEEDSD